MGFSCPHEEITSEMGMEPSEAYNKGDQATYGPSKFSFWQLLSPLPEGDLFLDEHLDALLPILETRAREIKNISDRYKVGINCVGYFRDVNPGFHLSADMIKRVSDLRLSIDFDLYCSCEESPN